MKPKRIEQCWLDYRNKVIPPFAPEVQVIESKRAFYAGAASLLNAVMVMLDQGSTEPTDADLEKMDQIQQELVDFAQEVEEERA